MRKALWREGQGTVANRRAGQDGCAGGAVNARRDIAPLPIPELEGTGPKEVFAFFGLCSYCAQLLGQGLANLAVALHIRGLTRLGPGDASAAFERTDRKTLGQLLCEVRRKVTVPQETEEALAKALDDRNLLSHRFFAQHADDFLSDCGRGDMIAELRSMATRLQTADRLVDELAIPLWERLGVTRERVEAETKRMREEAERRGIAGQQ
jgi:hypothetical protein